jgi:hypothetical protein
MTAGPFTRDGGEGDFAVPAVVDAAYSDEVLASGYNSAVLEPREDVALVLRVLEHEPERLRDFDEVATEARADLVAERAAAQAERDADAVLQRLREGAAVTAVAAEFDREWTRREAMTREEREAPRPVVDEAFALARPAEGERALGRAELEGGGVAVLTVTAVRPGDLAALTDFERTQLEQLLQRRQGATEFDAFRGALRRDLGVSARVDES